MHPAFQANLYGDALNLIELWIHSVLIHRGLYPAALFQQRTVFNTIAQVARPGPLADYVSDFMKELQAQPLWRVDKIEITIEDSDTHKPLQILDFTLQALELDMQNIGGNFAFQELDHKTFYQTLQRQLKSRLIPPVSRSFSLDITLLVGDRTQLQRLAQKWSTDCIQLDKKLQLTTSLRSANLEFTSGLYTIG